MDNIKLVKEGSGDEITYIVLLNGNRIGQVYRSWCRLGGAGWSNGHDGWGWETRAEAVSALVNRAKEVQP